MSDDRARQIVYELDEIARSYCHYEYGLPTHDEEQMERMVEVIKRERPDDPIGQPD